MNADETARAITDMSIRGAGRIARAAASALQYFAENYNGNDIAAFRKDLDKAVNVLVASRPTAVSLWNGVQSSIKGVDSAKDVNEAKAMIINNAGTFVTKSEKAVETIAKIGAKRIRDGDTVLTICNSSAAIGTMIEAYRQGKKIKVFAAETRPRRQGILTVMELSKAGVDVTLIVDSAVRSVMKDVDIVMVGADTITAQGAVVNKIGTSQVALAAYEARVPFVVCSETYKFSTATLFGDMVTIEERDASEVAKEGEIPKKVKVFNPVFDCTSSKYIDAIVTEEGMIHPAAVFGMMMRLYGQKLFERKE